LDDIVVYFRRDGRSVEGDQSFYDTKK